MKSFLSTMMKLICKAEKKFLVAIMEGIHLISQQNRLSSFNSREEYLFL